MAFEITLNETTKAKRMYVNLMLVHKCYNASQTYYRENSTIKDD